jgi:hypothetical protein
MAAIVARMRSASGFFFYTISSAYRFAGNPILVLPRVADLESFSLPASP